MPGRIRSVLFLLPLFFLPLNLGAFSTGILLPDRKMIDTDKICCVYVPQNGLNVYDAPGGKKIAVLKKDVDPVTKEPDPYRLVFLFSKDNSTLPVDEQMLKEIAYETAALVFTEKTNGYVRLPDTGAAYWLSEKEIKAAHFRVLSWLDFLVEYSPSVMGFYANPPGLNLRSEASAESTLLKTMLGDDFEIKLTGETKGNWAKVRVTKYKAHPCLSDLPEKENIEYTIEGWIKAVDDKGLPNLLFHPRGC